jgi:hypothetical protein
MFINVTTSSYRFQTIEHSLYPRLAHSPEDAGGRWCTWSRRRLLTGVGLLAGALMVPVAKLRRSTAPPVSGAAAQPSGELYAGFLLLPEDAPVPPTVGYRGRNATPIMEELPGGPRGTAVTSAFVTAAALRAQVPFPLYTLRIVTASVRVSPNQGFLVKHTSGPIYEASVLYESLTPHGHWSPTVTITTI